NGRRLTITYQLAIGLGVAQGIEYFHTHADKNSHENIKSANILVTTGLKVKLMVERHDSVGFLKVRYKNNGVELRRIKGILILAANCVTYDPSKRNTM
nr:probable inactive receptor kinase At1g48480 [Tanacetum cinerariifolium]